jgi:hypothetical protein
MNEFKKQVKFKNGEWKETWTSEWRNKNEHKKQKWSDMLISMKWNDQTNEWMHEIDEINEMMEMHKMIWIKCMNKKWRKDVNNWTEMKWNKIT